MLSIGGSTKQQKRFAKGCSRIGIYFGGRKGLSNVSRYVTGNDCQSEHDGARNLCESSVSKSTKGSSIRTEFLGEMKTAVGWIKTHPT